MCFQFYTQCYECHAVRGNLFNDVIDNLQEARHKAAEEVRKLKEKLDLPSSGSAIDQCLLKLGYYTVL